MYTNLKDFYHHNNLTSDTAGKLIHYWPSLGTVRLFNKSCYDRMRTDEVKYVDKQGSYNLFKQTSNTFHLIYAGDPYHPDFIEALIAYCTIDEIELSRFFGNGYAPKLRDRIPIVIIDDAKGHICDQLKEYAIAFPVDMFHDF